jgi:flagellar basal-body rod protein FlgF
MMNQRKHLSIISNNVANVNTHGYKKMEMDFSSLLSKKNGTEVAVFAQHKPLRIDLSSGNLSHTQNPLDMALQGDGMFAVNAGGDIEYTRNGHFLLDGEGNLITEQGYQVLDGNLAAITIPADATQLNVTREGTITTENGPLVDIGVFNFAEDAKIENVGQGRYRSDQAGILSENPQVLQGMLEDANVQAVEETVRLTELMRSYQSASNLVNRVEEVEERAIRDLSRVPS